jgi:TctA family transporter
MVTISSRSGRINYISHNHHKAMTEQGLFLLVAYLIGATIISYVAPWFLNKVNIGKFGKRIAQIILLFLFVIGLIYVLFGSL